MLDRGVTPLRPASFMSHVTSRVPRPASCFGAGEGGGCNGAEIL